MSASWWDQVWLPLLIGVAITIVVAALRIFSIRLWNYLMKFIKAQTVGESAHDHPLPDTGAAAHANGVLDLERGNSNGPAEDSESVTEPESGVGNSGEAWMEQFSDQEATHAPVIQSHACDQRLPLNEAPVEAEG